MHHGDNGITILIQMCDAIQKWTEAVLAGGMGAHGNSTGPDALFSQGSVATSDLGNVLATVNVSNLRYVLGLDANFTHSLDLIQSPCSQLTRKDPPT